MNKRNTILILFAGMAISAFAQQPFSFSFSKCDSQIGIVSNRSNDNNRAMKKGCSIFDLEDKLPQCQIRVLPEENPAKVPGDYGTEVVIMNEDFSKFSTGTLESPDYSTNIRLAQPEYPWTSLDPAYTTLAGWGAENVYPAGGTAYFDATESTGYAHINTPRVDVSGYGGIVFLQFKARTLSGTCHDLHVEAAETYDMSPTWDFLGGTVCPDVTDQWQTYEVMFYGGGKTTIFNIYEQLSREDEEFSQPVYLDDIKVFQIDQHVATPVTLPHSNYKGTSFDANWKAVEGAEAYLLDVYSYDEATKDISYILENQRVEKTSHTVTDVESGATYYYAVRSVKGEHVSIPTNAVEVFDLEAPVLKPVSGIVDGTYTANWDEVPTADVYNHGAYCERIAASDGEFVITDEDFTGVKDPEGNETGWTLEDPPYECYENMSFTDLKQGGWTGLNTAPYTNYVCVDGWHYYVGGHDAGLLSPELDLSKDGGKIKLSVKLYGEYVMEKDYDGVPYELQTEAAVALFNYDEEAGDFVQAELVYPEGIKDEWATFNVSLAKGTSRSVIGIYAVKAPGNLYIDDLKITQNYRRGESLLDPFTFKRYCDTNQLEVRLPGRTAHCDIFHKVSAVKSKGNADGTALRKESAFSTLEKVGTATSVIPHMQENIEVKVTDGKLNVLNPSASPIEVYSVGGSLICSDDSGNGGICVDLPARGAYIVKVGAKMTKVVY